MRTKILSGIAAVACLLGTMAAAQAQSQIHWAASYAAAMDQSRETRKLVLVEFYTDW
ncbi:MAG TPA: hypothetical protein VFA07_17735 [Chthonomonadaceae bacterium]|nr:hypothetical protein [Chthonomonadaceae bacterium]